MLSYRRNWRSTELAHYHLLPQYKLTLGKHILSAPPVDDGQITFKLWPERQSSRRLARMKHI